MIVESRGNLLETDAEALVNTVNCVGHMGKGIALQFKQAFPENFKAYARACRAEEVQPGRILAFETGSRENPRLIFNFPTKRHWRGKSRIEDIESGLASLVREVRERRVGSIAIPPLGCGHGGLDWEEVRPRIVRAFEDLPDVRVLLFGPHGSPDPRRMPVRTSRPRMTTARAILIQLMDQYAASAYRLTLLEIQKLAYLLQEAGEPLRLRFTKSHYGPFAHGLNKALERLEGHFIRGYGDDPKPDQDIHLLTGAREAANEVLAGDCEAQRRLGSISRLIDGFETPYGMELLASIHWVATHDDPPAKSEEQAIEAVRGWNVRKGSTFQPEHLGVAWRRLKEDCWIPAR